MADWENRVADNQAGRYFVTYDCINCGVCNEIAPDHFSTGDEGWAYVAHQPEDAGERDLCDEAIDACPVDAIGDNG